MNEVTSSQDELSEVDNLYRRFSASDPGRPGEWVRRKVQAYAAQQAAERAVRESMKGREAASPVAAPAPAPKAAPAVPAPFEKKQSASKPWLIPAVAGAVVAAGVVGASTGLLVRTGNLSGRTATDRGSASAKCFRAHAFTTTCSRRATAVAGASPNRSAGCTDTPAGAGPRSAARSGAIGCWIQLCQTQQLAPFGTDTHPGTGCAAKRAYSAKCSCRVSRSRCAERAANQRASRHSGSPSLAAASTCKQHRDSRERAGADRYTPSGGRTGPPTCA
jgi:hypothetical protein